MTNEEKYKERLDTIRQILVKAKLNPDFNELGHIYKLSETETRNENN